MKLIFLVLSPSQQETGPMAILGNPLQSVSCRVLHSWKEIANYMGRGVRTLQRYEAQLALPIHRPSAHNRSAVLAFTDELDAWLKGTPIQAQEYAGAMLSNGSSYLVLRTAETRNGDSADLQHPIPLTNREVLALLLSRADAMRINATGSSNGRLQADLEAIRKSSSSTAPVRAPYDCDGDSTRSESFVKGSRWESLDQVLDAAIEATRADLGNLQLLDSHSGTLKIVCQRGFRSPFINFFNSVRHGQAACGTALKNRTRVIIEDVISASCYTAQARDAMLKAGALACQSTPLIDSSGRLFGVVSTHYKTCTRPSSLALQRLDSLARQISADPIARVLCASNKA